MFIGLASEWDDHPEHRQALERQIVDAARELLDRDELRRWVRFQARPGYPPTAEPVSLTPIAPNTLPISDGLTDALLSWSARYDETFLSEPERSGFADIEEAERFVAQGRLLAEALQGALGDAWHVEYYPEPTRPPGVRLR